jgi:hypothetical protein
MGHQSVAEKGADPLFGTIVELIGNNDIQGTNVLFKASNGGNGDDLFDSQFFKPVYICPEIELRGAEPMAAPVSGQKGNPDAFQGSGDVCVRWVAEGRIDRDLRNIR